MTNYLGSGDAERQRRDHHPAWIDNLAEDVTIEASVMTGIARGVDAVRAIISHAGTLYAYQEFNFIGDYDEHGTVEDYTSRVHGEPIGSIVVVRYNAAGQTQQIIVNHRPLRSVLLWSNLMAKHFAGTPYADYFLATDLA